jgi:hypothetical protein
MYLIVQSIFYASESGVFETGIGTAFHPACHAIPAAIAVIAKETSTSKAFLRRVRVFGVIALAGAVRIGW